MGYALDTLDRDVEGAEGWWASMRRLFTDEKFRAEIATCRKVNTEVVECWCFDLAQVDRLNGHA